MKNKLLLIAMGFALTTQMIIAQVPSYVPTSGLVGYWPFNGNANDESGNGNNGVVTGANLTSDRNGNANSAYYFNGINNFISTQDSNSLSILNDITISAWVYDISDSQNYHTIVNKRINGNWSYGVSLSFYYGPGGSPSEINKVFSGRRNNFGAEFEYKFSNEPFVFGQWMHIVVRIQNNIITFYRNGVDIGFNLFGNQFTIPMINQATGLTIGSNGENGEWLKGNLDDIGIWNRALTQEEITGLYYSENSCQSLVINTGVLSFDPPTYNNTVTIYPNPANDHITIDCGNLANVSGWNIKIYNTLSQVGFSGAMNTQQYVVPLNSWSGQGVYFVKIYDGSNNLVNTKKIILQ